MSDTKAIRRPGGGADGQAGPLAGLRAVILGQRLGGLVAGMLLSDQGAQVAHVELGDGVQPDEQPVIDAARRDAIVVTVDRLTGEGVKTAADLLRDADVVVSTVGGRSDRRTAHLRSVGPIDEVSNVWVSIPTLCEGDGADVPYSDGAAAALSGVYTDTSVVRSLLGLGPLFTALPLPSVYAGVHAATAAVAGSIVMVSDGPGQDVEVPLVGAAMSAMGGVLYRADGQPSRYDVPPLPGPVKAAIPAVRTALRAAPRSVQRRAAEVAGSLTPPVMDSYRCADGRWLYVFAVDHRRLTRELLRATGVLDQLEERSWEDRDPYATSRKGRVSLSDITTFSPPFRQRLRKMLSAALATRPAVEWERVLNEAGVPAAVQRTSAEWISTPAARDAGLIRDRLLADGTLLTEPGPAVWTTGSVVETKERSTRPIARALDGCTVLDLASMVAGPSCGRALAEYGATVIKVDSPSPLHGPRLTCHFGLEVNQGKRGVLIDLSDAEGRRAFGELAASADVIVHNFTKGAQERLHLEELAPEVTMCVIGGYAGPESTPQASWRAYDPILQAATGVMLRYGSRRPELHAIASCADYLTGYLAAFGVMSTQFAAVRDHSRPRSVATSLAAAIQLCQLPYVLGVDGRPTSGAEPSGQEANGFSALRRLYRARDKWVYVDAPDREAAADVFATSARSINLDDHAAVANVIRSADAAVWRARFAAVGAACVPVNTIEEIRRVATGADPATATIVVRRASDHPCGYPVDTVAPLHARLSRTPLIWLEPAPKPGSDTVQVLRDAGLAAERIDALVRSGVASEQLADEYLPK